MDYDKPVGSHHGIPDLTQRDITLLEAHALWVKTAIAAGSYPVGWMPHHPDWIKSRLFWRIRSGKQPLEYPPPTCYSCPWYELIEMPEVSHSTYEIVRTVDFLSNDIKSVIVAQCRYVYISGPMDNPTQENPMIIKYGQYKFRAWNGANTSRMEPAGYIKLESTDGL